MIQGKGLYSQRTPDIANKKKEIFGKDLATQKTSGKKLSEWQKREKEFN